MRKNGLPADRLMRTKPGHRDAWGDVANRVRAPIKTPNPLIKDPSGRQTGKDSIVDIDQRLIFVRAENQQDAVYGDINAIDLEPMQIVKAGTSGGLRIVEEIFPVQRGKGRACRDKCDHRRKPAGASTTLPMGVARLAFFPIWTTLF
jgi:hypothetical protein